MEKITSVNCGSFKIGTGNPLALIAGPCVIESEKLTFEIAEKLKAICEKLDIPLIFKASFDKANRTSIDSYRGPGIKNGLEILKSIKTELNLPVVTDVHLPDQIPEVAQVADMLQIPAFLCRQTDMLVAAAKTGKIVNIKKGQFMAPWDMSKTVEKVVESGNKNILLTDRGVTFGYNNLVTDIRAIPVMKEFCPVVFDATHSVQQPGGLGNISGGNREFIVPLARAAVASGADALFMEVHPDPENGLSDAASMYPLGEMEKFLSEVKKLNELVRTFE